MRPEWNAADVRTIEKALVRVLRDNLYGGEEVVLIEPFNGPRPRGAYASLAMIACRAEPHEVYDYDERDGDELWEGVKGERYCRLRLQFYNAGARQRAVDCQNLLRSTNRNFDMAPITGFGEVGEFQDITAEYLGKQEERATMTVELYANLSAEYRSNNIEIVTGDIVHDDGEAQPYRSGGDSCKLTFGPNEGKP